MSDRNKVRLAHELLDEVNAREDLTPRQVGVLRSFLPERPKQKTLEEIAHDVYDAWGAAYGNDWADDVFGELETWLHELHAQLQEIKDAPATVPALPAGMRLADHEEYGRVVVSPSDDESNDAFRIFYRDEGYATDTLSRFVESSSLTFIDSEPAHPEFLETEADYENAPEGTIVARDGIYSWTKEDDVWVQGVAVDETVYTVPCLKGPRRVLRWGWGE